MDCLQSAGSGKAQGIVLRGGYHVPFFMGRDPVELAKRAKYKPPAMRVRDDCYTKKSPFRYNEVVQANL